MITEREFTASIERCWLLLNGSEPRCLRALADRKLQSFCQGGK